MEMEKWPEERVAAYKSYVEKDTKEIEKLEAEYQSLQNSLRETIERIQRIENIRNNHRAELYIQGWDFKGSEWVEVDK